MRRISSASLLASAALAMSLTTLAQAGITIKGTPGTTATVSTRYQFQPTVTSTDNLPISFAIQNKPAWAAFLSSTGQLVGKPGTADAGTTFSNIQIIAKDSVSRVALPAFSIKVAASSTTSTITTGAATINWTPPTTNTNGTTLTNLAGYTINYGTSATALNTAVKLANPGLTSYVVGNLTTGTYYFTVTAYTSTGTTSAPSSVVSKTIL